MADLVLIEQRLSELEREMAELKKRLPPASPQRNWVEDVAGSMKEFPEFAEVVRLGREFRAAQTDPAQ